MVTPATVSGPSEPDWGSRFGNQLLKAAVALFGLTKALLLRHTEVGLGVARCGPSAGLEVSGFCPTGE